MIYYYSLCLFISFNLLSTTECITFTWISSNNTQEDKVNYNLAALFTKDTGKVNVVTAAGVVFKEHSNIR